MRGAHTTKKGPGRRHADGTYRNGKLHTAKFDLPHGEPGDKLRRKAIVQTLTKR